MRRITVSLGNIDEAIRQLEEYEKRVQQNVESFLKRLLDEGVEIAKAKIVSLPAVESGELLGSIKPVQIDGNKGFIVADNAHAVFVEFGTGVTNNGSHPKRGDLGLKDLGTYGEGKGADPNGWWYYDEKQGRKRWTKGKPSRPFMYETARDLERIVAEIAMEVFSR